MSRKQDYEVPDIYEITMRGYAQQVSEMVEDYLADNTPPSLPSHTTWVIRDSKVPHSGNTGKQVIWERLGDCSLYIDVHQESFNPA